MTFEYSNTINCTKEEAWSFITEIERRPEWIHFMDKCHWITKKNEIVGSEYKEEEIFLGFHIDVKYKVIEYKEFEKMTSKCDMFPFHQKVEISMKENINGTVFTKLIINADLGVLGLVPKFILNNRVNALVQPLVDEFKLILERESSLR